MLRPFKNHHAYSGVFKSAVLQDQAKLPPHSDVFGVINKSGNPVFSGFQLSSGGFFS